MLKKKKKEKKKAPTLGAPRFGLSIALFEPRVRNTGQTDITAAFAARGYSVVDQTVLHDSAHGRLDGQSSSLALLLAVVASLAPPHSAYRRRMRAVADECRPFQRCFGCKLSQADSRKSKGNERKKKTAEGETERWCSGIAHLCSHGIKERQSVLACAALSPAHMRKGQGEQSLKKAPLSLLVWSVRAALR